MRGFLAAHWAILAAWVLALSALSFVQMGFDKGRARRGGRRVRERTLWLTALLGGGPGAFLGMQTFRHKTRHLQFQIVLPALAVLDVALLVWSYPG